MAGNKPPVSFDYAVLCDDIRKEDNGKLILIGVYTGNILVSTFPAHLGAAAYLHGFATSHGDFPLEIRYRVECPDTKVFQLQGMGTVNVQGPTSEIGTPVVKAILEVAKPGWLSLAYRLEGGRWKTLLKKEISLKGPSV